MDQSFKWFLFSDEEDCPPLPVTEGNNFVFVQYLSFESRISAKSAPQYVNSISRYPEDSIFASQTKPQLV